MDLSSARRAHVVLLIAGALLVAGCSGDDKPETDATSTPAVPLPPGVELTEPGATLEVGEAATAVYEAGRGPAAVVTVTVSAIRRGSQRDLRGFTLAPAFSRSTPWYADAVVRTVGEQPLSGAAVPLFGYDSDQTYFRAAEIHGGLDVCRSRDLPARMRPGDRLKTCLVFFVPPAVDLEAVQLRTDDDAEPISWPVPAL